jgi:hypothetical protein
VRQTGRKVLTEPMGAAERRVIHLALNEDPDITTFAIGEGLVKAITIAPIDQAPPPEERRPAGRFGGGRRDFDRGRERGGRGDRGDSGGRGGRDRGGYSREGGRGPGSREGGRSPGGHGRPSGPGMGGRGPGGPGGGRDDRRPGPGRERGGYAPGGRGPSAGGERGGQYPDARGRSGPPMGGGERSGQWERSGGVRDSRPPREGERDWRGSQEPRPRDEGWASESRESRPRRDYGDRDPRVGDRDPRAGDRAPRPGDRAPRPGDRDPRARDSRVGGRDPRGPEHPKPGPSFLSDNESWDPIGDGEFIDDFSPDDPAVIPEDQPPTPPADEQPRAERRPGRSWRGRGEGGRRR